MKRVLVTGFEPFLSHKENPTQQIVDQLQDRVIGDYQVHGVILPVTFSEAAKIVIDSIDHLKPDAIMMLGLAAGRNRITPERVAINVNDGEVDNDGVKKQDEPIIEGGPAAYFSTLPIRKFIDALTKEQIPASISNTAGTYVCNNIMYQVLHALNDQNRRTPAGFIHVPASHQLALETANVPSLSLHEMVQAVEIMIGELEG
ncbi:pyroglutamyl-peptidase I [Bacillus sp. FJAT-45037]|uniref:pyroglutamyl-peptidase I n=1 Tax=Bacillus sp. FJAT-45037 TaxID=2011007 RepID=UPI000C23B4A1|nr:pyroglutamyl-peptidase I [Bacillus sp. FJAT-45037]